MERADIEQGGTDGTDQYFCVSGELVVHDDDLGPVIDDLKRRQVDFTADKAAGAYTVVTLPGRPRVHDLVVGMRSGAGADRRVSPNYVFGATSGARAPMSAFPALATDGHLAPTTGDSSVRVAVLDTGIVLNDETLSGSPHPWFGGRVSFDPHDEDTLPEPGGLLHPAHGHGTLVAGIILGEAPDAHVRTARILEDGVANDRLVADALTRLTTEGFRLFNLSFSGDVLDESTAPPLIDQALQDLPSDAVVVAAAGNFGDHRPVWPAASKRVIGVGAAEDFGRPLAASFTGRGAWTNAFAPGISVLGPFCSYTETPSVDRPDHPAQRFRGWARGTGTSFAAAVVTGRIAQLCSTGMKPADAADEVFKGLDDIRAGDVDRPFLPSLLSGPSA
jgi:hypothetical protein